MERQSRLRRSADIEQVKQRGRSWSHPLLILIAHPNELDFTRVGVAASRRLGKAVVRNRAKRLLREAACHLYPRLAPGWDLLLVARAKILQAKESQVREALGLLADRAKLVV
jgi:ribonuclease P protein component